MLTDNSSSRSWLSQYPAFAACVLFVGLFGVFHWWKPSFAYREDGTLKPFGVKGRRGTTVITSPAIAVGLAALCYAMVLRAVSQ